MGRGGNRTGSGRPKIDRRLIKVPVSYRLPQWLVNWLRGREESAAELIEDALKARHGIEPPK